MNDRTSTAYPEAEQPRAALQAALAASRMARMRLPGNLEQAYHDRRNLAAVNDVRAHWLLVVASLAVLGAFTFFSGLAEGAIFGLVVFGYGSALVVSVLVALGATIPALQPRIDAFLIVGAFVVLGGLQIGAAVTEPGSVLRSTAEYGVIFVTVAVFTISHLSFRQSLSTVLVTTGTFLLATLLLSGVEPDWLRYAYFAGGSLVIGSLMGLSQEVRDRTVFLQERLLVLEKQELDELSLELGRISREDALTGLANRRHFNEMYQREWSVCQREGILMNLFFIDVDYFKRYNDHYGHQAGDECLRRVAAVLAEQARRGSDLVARYGGEEFVAFFPRTNLDGLGAIAARMIEAVDALQLPHAASDVAPHVTISVGVSMRCPRQGESPELLMQAADAALYAAKQAGRHRFVVDGQPG